MEDDKEKKDMTDMTSFQEKEEEMITLSTKYGVLNLFKTDTTIIEYLKKHDYWQEERLKTISPFIDPTRNVIEIGCYCGVDTLFLNQHCSFLYGFEPQEKPFELLVKNMKNNHLENKTKMFRSAAFCRNGIEQMIDKKNRILSMNATMGGDGESVSCVCLDDMDELQNIGCIYCDSNGSESIALWGAKEIIRRDRPLIVIVENEMLKKRVDAFYEKNMMEEIQGFDIKKYCMEDLKYFLSAKGPYHIFFPDVIVDIYQKNVFSKFGEDGIIEFLMTVLYKDERDNKTFVRVGKGMNLATEMKYVIDKYNWKGLFVDSLSSFPWETDGHSLLYTSCGYNEFYNLQTILKRTKTLYDIIVCEYNPYFGVMNDTIVIHDPDKEDTIIKEEQKIYGASLFSLTILLNGFGYDLVASTQKRAFFILQTKTKDTSFFMMNNVQGLYRGGVPSSSFIQKEDHPLLISSSSL